MLPSMFQLPVDIYFKEIKIWNTLPVGVNKGLFFFSFILEKHAYALNVVVSLTTYSAMRLLRWDDTCTT